MTLKLNIVNLAWEPVAGASSYDILLDGVKVAQAGPRAKTTKINIPEGAEHKVTIKAQPFGTVQEATFAWSSVVPAPPATAIDTWEAVGHPSSDPIAQAFPVYYQDNLAKGWWGQQGVDFITELQTPMYDGRYHDGVVISSWEWWYLYEFYIDPAWTQSDEGNQYAFILDLHNCPGDVGWSDVPPASGVSAMHTRYQGGNLLLQHEYNSPNVFTVSTNISKGVWHSVLGRLILGRTDGSVPSSGHPNGGAGRSWIWLDGAATPFDTGDITILQKNPSTGVVQTRLDCLSGAYWPRMGSAHMGRFVTARWGRTFAEARDSRPIYGHMDDHPDISMTKIASRSSTDFVLPPGF